jgi:hypothetical protein
MPKQKLEIECPVCDAKLSIDARSCPKCGADLGMADFQDLERLANDISGGSASSESPKVGATKETETGTGANTGENIDPSKDKSNPENNESTPPVEPTSQEAPKEEAKGNEEPDDKGKKKGLFSKFFGKKK